MKSRFTDFHPVRRDRLVQETRHDTYKAKHKLPEPTVCPQCGAVFHDGRWQWLVKPAQAHEEMCPACHRIHDDYPAGYVSVNGPFFKDHRSDLKFLSQEIVNKWRCIPLAGQQYYFFKLHYGEGFLKQFVALFYFAFPTAHAFAGNVVIPAQENAGFHPCSHQNYEGATRDDRQDCFWLQMKCRCKYGPVVVPPGNVSVSKRDAENCWQGCLRPRFQFSVQNNGDLRY